MRGTVKSKDDMERLFREGRRSSSYLAMILCSPSPASDPQGRLGFVAGKKLGSAPYRNRCKRVLRAAAAELGGPWQGYDVVFVARRGVATADHEKVCRMLADMLDELEVNHG